MCLHLHFRPHMMGTQSLVGYYQRWSIVWLRLESMVWLRLQRVPAVVFEGIEGLQHLVAELSWSLQVSVVLGTTELS